MTAEQAPEVPDGTLVIPEPTTAPVDAQNVPGARQPFTMPQPEGEEPVIYWAVRPKGVLLLHLGEKLAVAADDEDLLLDAFRAFGTAALDPESYDHLWARFGDPGDTLDVPHMRAVMSTFMERWTARPTQPRSGRSPLPRATGRASTGRSRAKGRTQQD